MRVNQTVAYIITSPCRDPQVPHHQRRRPCECASSQPPPLRPLRMPAASIATQVGPARRPAATAGPHRQRLPHRRPHAPLPPLPPVRVCPSPGPLHTSPPTTPDASCCPPRGGPARTVRSHTGMCACPHAARPCRRRPRIFLTELTGIVPQFAREAQVEVLTCRTRRVNCGA